MVDFFVSILNNAPKVLFFCSYNKITSLISNNNSLTTLDVSSNTYFLYMCYWCTHTNCECILQVWGIVGFSER